MLYFYFMDFLETVFLDNTIKSYCIAVGVILLMLVLKRYFSRYLTSILYRFFYRIWPNVVKNKFTDLVAEPLEWLLFILIAIFTIDKLNFPSAWYFKIYGYAIDDVLSRVGIGIIILVFTWFLLRIIDFIALILEQKAAVTSDKTDDQLVVFFRDFFKVIIAIIGFLLIIKACFKQPVGNLLTSLSVVGAVMALAARESLENLIASFIIFFDKPFTTGDTLKVNAVTGTVEKIGLRSTRIRTADKTLVTVPNKQMVDSVVDNWSMRTHRRAEIKLNLPSATTAITIKTIINRIKQQLEKDKHLITSYAVHLTEINRPSTLLVTEYFTGPITFEEFTSLKEQYNFFIKTLLEEHNINLGNEVAIDNILKNITPE